MQLACWSGHIEQLLNLAGSYQNVQVQKHCPTNVQTQDPYLVEDKVVALCLCCLWHALEHIAFQRPKASESLGSITS